MENYAGARFETKIETFEPCMIDVTTSRREIVESNERQEDAAEMQENARVDASQDEIQQSAGQIATGQPNSMTDMTLTAVRLPALLDGQFFSVVRVEDTNVTVRCLQCDKLLNGNLKSTGNFLSHIKRVHPFMIDTIKCKSNQRRPAIAYVDMTSEKTMETAKSKRVHRKFCKPLDDNQTVNGEETVPEQGQNWTDSPIVRRRKYDETTTFPKSPENQKYHQNNNSSIAEDEFDAIGKNVAAKLRNMRLDQRIVAEKLLNDVLFEAQLGTLHRDSSLHV